MGSFKHSAFIASFSLAAFTLPTFACGPTDSVYMGAICATAASFCPQGYAPADGRLLAVSDNQALYSLLGNSYGGDGRTNFGLPDLRGRSAIGLGSGTGLSPVIRGQRRGSESVVQTVQQLATHSHAVTGSAGAVSVTLTAKQVTGVNSPEQGYFLGAGGSGPGTANMYVAPTTQAPEVQLGGVTVSGGGAGSIILSNTGSSVPAPNIPPQIVVNYCVALQGLYPPRP